jgi:hypothetical protein
MNFFGQQEQARRQTRTLRLRFTLAVPLPPAVVASYPGFHVNPF